MKKRLTAVLLCAAMVLGLTACSGKESSVETAAQTTAPATEASLAEGGAKTPQDFKKFKIGVCEPQAIDEVVIRRDYYENYLASRYNVEFVFSEQCKDTDDELTFIEGCADAGCDAIISYRSVDANQMAQVCEEYGMQYVINTARIPEVDGAFEGGYETFQGSFGADNEHVGQLFRDWLSSNASDDGSEGFMITSSLAFSGNIQHLETAIAALSALQSKYNLTFEDTVENLAKTSAPIEVANDKGINIYIYPGSPSGMEGWLEGVSAALQTGKYGALIHSGQSYAQTAVVVDEVEKNFDKDIKVASIASMSESLINAFNTQDKFGNSSLNMAFFFKIHQSGKQHGFYIRL
jgi:ABC-type sugar transport system substrate-binding protein